MMVYFGVVDKISFLRGDNMCKHWECPYKYCPYHENYDEELEVICEWVIPNIEWGRTPENCISYLDV